MSSWVMHGILTSYPSPITSHTTHHTSHITHHPSPPTDVLMGGAWHPHRPLQPSHHTSHITHHTSHITHHPSHITHHTYTHTSHITYPISHITSHITNHTSPITYHTWSITYIGTCVTCCRRLVTLLSSRKRGIGSVVSFKPYCLRTLVCMHALMPNTCWWTRCLMDCARPAIVTIARSCVCSAPAPIQQTSRPKHHLHHRPTHHIRR